MTEKERSGFEVDSCLRSNSGIWLPENLFPRSFFCAIIGKFDDDREVRNEVTGFEVASKMPRKY